LTWDIYWIIGGKFVRLRATGGWLATGAIGGVFMAVGDWGGDGAKSVDSDKDEGALPGYVPWIFAEADEGWREKRKWNPKRMGEMSQAAFLLKAQSLGFGLAVPWGDSEKFDFVVWAGPGGRLVRVQVKATGRLHRGGYDVQPVYSTRGEGKKRYTAREIDVLAARVVRQADDGDVWYLLPVAAIALVKSLRFFPGLKGRDPRWEGYREAWEWLEGEAE
jgi:hypothetical protein